MNPTTDPLSSLAFVPFPKLPRLSRECVITEKIDGTNGQVVIAHQLEIPPGLPEDSYIRVQDSEGRGWAILAGSRNRWLSLNSDNFGFWQWVSANRHGLLALGPGRHFGEWWGSGIQRVYGLSKKRFSLFNVTRWCLHGEAPKLLTAADAKRGAVEKYQDVLPEFVGLVPVLFRGQFDTAEIEDCLRGLAYSGSVAAPGFMKPEGIVIYHTASGTMFKKTVENDETPKSLVV